MIAIVDYEAGNIASIGNMLKKIGADFILTSDPAVISQAEKIILPGVGAFDYGIEKLTNLNLIEVLRTKTLTEMTPTLGICLGAQLMCGRSEEGKMPGLGWIHAQVRKLPTLLNGNRLRVPHMGWEFVEQTKNSRLCENLPKSSRFYFVHSYHIQCLEEQDVLFKTDYGIIFHSAFQKNNILGVQFHPEKSHNFGKQLLKNFVENF